MKNNEMIIRSDEQIMFTMRRLFESFGYSQYKMIKFEEYDLYAKNKNFLLGESVITFTDMSGKLLALKPDVTLSIVKNTVDKPEEITKVYYNENVYRVSKSAHNFKEIMQIGLECLGDVDSYRISEVLTLAAKSLKLISGDCMLSISDLAITLSVIENICSDTETQKKIITCIGEKNQHTLKEICNEAGISEENTAILTSLAVLHGKPDYVFSELDRLFGKNEAVEKLRRTVSSLDDSLKDIIEIDFSFVGDINYYNGIIFSGYINGIPNTVLSGGQYDNLMQKMGRSSKGIGFAIYSDELERLTSDKKEFDSDVVILYSKGADVAALNKEAVRLNAEGKSVAVFKKLPGKYRYKELIDFTNGKEGK